MWSFTPIVARTSCGFELHGSYRDFEPTEGSLPRLTGTSTDHEGLLGTYWGLLRLIGLGRLPLGSLLIPI